MTVNNPEAVAALNRVFIDTDAQDAQVIIDALDVHGMAIVDRSLLALLLGASTAVLWQQKEPSKLLIDTINQLAACAGMDVSRYTQGMEKTDAGAPHVID